jgi:hypothetical protein
VRSDDATRSIDPPTLAAQADCRHGRRAWHSHHVTIRSDPDVAAVGMTPAIVPAGRASTERETCRPERILGLVPRNPVEARQPLRGAASVSQSSAFTHLRRNASAPTRL